MEKLIIYHNPRCAKSREALSIIEAAGKEAKVVEYLKNPLNIKELAVLLKKLKLKAEDIIRTKEPLYKEKFGKKKYTEAEWLAILATNPILIERPIAVKGNKAVIGRPTENIKKLL